MRFLFDPDSMVMAFIRRFADLAVLNLVFLLTCIPVFTIGAAVTALYDVVFRMDTDREGKLLPSYFQAFFGNFKQGTLLFLGFFLFGAATCMNIQRFSELPGGLGFGLFLLAMLILVVLTMTAGILFPLLSRFHSGTVQTLRNALLLALGYLPRSLAVLTLNCFPWVLMLVNFYAFSRMLPLWLFFYFAAAAYINSRLLNKVFAPHAP